MEPGAGPAGGVGQGVQVVERAGVDVAGLRARDAGPVDGGDGLGEGRGVDPSLLVGRHAHELPLPDAEHAQRDEHGGVHLLADDHRHGRAAGEAVAVGVLAAGA